MKFLLVLIFLNLSLTFADEGFFKLDHPEAPVWIKEAQKSVFMVLPYEHYEFSEKLSQEKINYYLENFCKSPSHIIHKLNCQHFSECKTEKCNFYPHKSKGSGFLIGEGEKLITSFHVLYGLHKIPLLFMAQYLSSIEDSEAEKNYIHMRPEFKLVDANHRIVFDTKKHQELPVYTNLSNVAKFTVSYNNEEDTTYLSRDYAEIKLPLKLGKGLSLAYGSYSSQSSSETIYALGFPAKAQRERVESSSSGEGIYFMKGKAHNFESSIHSFKSKNSNIVRFLQNKDSKVLATCLDSQSGASGGPLFNLDGDVIGIQSGTFRDQGDSDPDKYQGLSFAVHVDQMISTDLSKYYSR